MTWANLGILGVGGLMVVVPIVLHFLFQPKPISVDFPALRFLKQKQQITRSRLRLKHLALLLIRCLLIALVALALAGPSVASTEFSNWITLGGVGTSGLVVALIGLLAFFQSKKNGLLLGVLAAAFFGHLIFGGLSLYRIWSSDTPNLIGDSQAPVAALVVIDASPRMALEFENQTRLAKAQEIGQWLLTQFPRDSQVCIAANDGDVPFFSVDVGAADRRITKLTTNFSGAKLPAAIEAGLEVLETSQFERKEIYVLTDLTVLSWLGANNKKLLRQLQQRSEYSLFVVDVGVEDPNNFLLGELLMSTAELPAKGTLNIQTEIRRVGAAGQRTIKMQVEKIDSARPVVRDGVTRLSEKAFAPQTQVVQIRENGSAIAKFSFNQQLTTGTYHGSVAIEGKDGLAIDDQRYFTFRVSPARRTLVVHPENVSPRPLLSLLAPQGDIDQGANRFEYQAATQDQFVANEKLAPFDAIFLLDPQPLNDTVWKRLESYVDAGGGVGIFLGQNASNRGVIDSSFTTAIARRVIGGQLDQQWFDETGELFLSPGELSHPVFRLIQGSETAVLWNRSPIFKHWGIVPDTAATDPNAQSLPTQTVLRFSNREPAMIERTIGNGRTLTMTTPIIEADTPGNQQWNLLLGIRPVTWWLLTKGIVEHLVQSDADALNVTVGQISNLKNDLSRNPDSYQVFSPDLEKSPTALNTVDGAVRFRFNDTPGHYRYRGVFDEQVVLRGFSSNLPTESTNLTRVDASDLDEVLGADRYQLATQKNEIQRQQGTTRRGQELYPMIVVIMLVIMGVEFLMSNRFY